ncbi:hypothetical protein OV079_52775 [Nannocystis pusilla]|uniref:Uncharacterized protein n=1 Tax=Nannocystis pusilla TaxID=889268 RepID=A0A9X3F1D9_9BACT|nr:hypothetical protein [Nannocystis pusilla]MCY1014056.1 hypothetical protein [Nannocystis pusilla]
MIEGDQGALERGEALGAEPAVDHELAEDARKRAVEATGMTRVDVVHVDLGQAAPAEARDLGLERRAVAAGAQQVQRQRALQRRPLQPAASRPSGKR